MSEKQEKCPALIKRTGRYEHRRVSEVRESIETHNMITIEGIHKMPHKYDVM